jgi:hypothetical protein
MAFAIPRIQYKNVDTTGDTVISNGVITAIPSTALIEIGMFVRGVGIPTGALVGSKTATTVTLAAAVLATANGTGIALSFGYEILFDFPPIEETGESLESKNNTSESLSGIRQVSINYIQAVRKMLLSHLTQSLYESVRVFFNTHAVLGKQFRYFDNKTLSAYTTVELDKLIFQPKKITPAGEDVYVWEVPLNVRRAL